MMYFDQHSTPDDQTDLTAVPAAQLLDTYDEPPSRDELTRRLSTEHSDSAEIFGQLSAWLGDISDSPRSHLVSYILMRALQASRAEARSSLSRQLTALENSDECSERKADVMSIFAMAHVATPESEDLRDQVAQSGDPRAVEDLCTSLTADVCGLYVAGQPVEAFQLVQGRLSLLLERAVAPPRREGFVSDAHGAFVSMAVRDPDGFIELLTVDEECEFQEITNRAQVVLNTLNSEEAAEVLEPKLVEVVLSDPAGERTFAFRWALRSRGILGIRAYLNYLEDSGSPQDALGVAKQISMFGAVAVDEMVRYADQGEDRRLFVALSVFELMGLEVGLCWQDPEQAVEMAEIAGKLNGVEIARILEGGRSSEHEELVDSVERFEAIMTRLQQCWGAE